MHPGGKLLPLASYFTVESTVQEIIFAFFFQKVSFARFNVIDTFLHRSTLRMEIHSEMGNFESQTFAKDTQVRNKRTFYLLFPQSSYSHPRVQLPPTPVIKIKNLSYNLP